MKIEEAYDLLIKRNTSYIKIAVGVLAAAMVSTILMSSQLIKVMAEQNVIGKGETSGLLAQIESLKAENTALDKTVDRLGANLDSNGKALLGQIRDLQQDFASCNAELNGLQEAVSVLPTSHKGLGPTNTDPKSVIKYILESNADLESDVSELTERNSDLAGKNKKLEDRIEVLKKENAEYKNDISTYKKQILRKDRQVKTLTDQKTTLNRDKKKLEKDKKNLQSKIDELTKKLASAVPKDKIRIEAMFFDTGDLNSKELKRTSEFIKKLRKEDFIVNGGVKANFIYAMYINGLTVFEYKTPNPSSKNR